MGDFPPLNPGDKFTVKGSHEYTVVLALPEFVVAVPPSSATVLAVCAVRWEDIDE